MSKAQKLLSGILGRFVVDMAKKHKVDIEELNFHISGGELIVQKCEGTHSLKFIYLESIELSDLN